MYPQFYIVQCDKDVSARGFNRMKLSQDFGAPLFARPADCQLARPIPGHSVAHYQLCLFHLYLLPVDRIAAGSAAGLRALQDGLQRCNCGAGDQHSVDSNAEQPAVGGAHIGPRGGEDFGAVGHGGLHGERVAAAERGTAGTAEIAGPGSVDCEPPDAGRGREFGIDRIDAVGHNQRGSEHTAKVISYNGISTYGAQAVGAPLGVVLAGLWGLPMLGAVTVAIGGASFVLAWRKAPVAVIHRGAFTVPAHDGAGGSARNGAGLGGTGYAVLAAFVTLFYMSRHWSGAALCLTAFGLSFILARLLFLKTIDLYGGFAVSIVSLSVEASTPLRQGKCAATFPRMAPLSPLKACQG